MDTLELVDKRIRHALERVNKKRIAADKVEVRIDLDTPLRGYLQLREEFEYRFRVDMQFQPLMMLEVRYTQNVYYFSIEGLAYESETYQVLKHPPRSNSNRNETYWLANELDTPLAAIEKYMGEVLA